MQPKPRRWKRVIAWLVVFLLIGGAIAAWFLTEQPREQRASRFDRDAIANVNRTDYANAYRDARFSQALSPSAKRLLAVGATAALASDWDAAGNAFEKAAEKGDGVTASQARVGGMLAAAHRRDYKAYQRLVTAFGKSNDRVVQLGAAWAAMRNGDATTAQTLLPTTGSRQATWVGALVDTDANPTKAAVALQSIPADDAKIDSLPQPFRQYLLRELHIEPERVTALQAALGTLGGGGKATQEARLANAYYKAGEFALAVAAGQRSVQEAPTYRDSWQTLAAAQIARGDYAAAERSLKAATDLDIASGYTWYLRAELARAKGDNKKAAEYEARAKLLGYDTNK